MLWHESSTGVEIGQELGFGQAVLGCVPRSEASPGWSHKPAGHTPKLGWHCAEMDLCLCPAALDTQYEKDTVG